MLLRDTVASLIKAAGLRAAMLAALVASTATQPVEAHPSPFTVEQIMSAPFPSSLVSSPSGHSIAWVFDEQGRRNVWIADASAGAKAHPLTQFAKDEGVNIAEVAWSPDGQWIAFTRAADLEEELPANIVSSPAGPVSQEVWLVPTGGGPARKIANGHHPTFTPDSSRVLYLLKGQVFSAASSGEPAAAPLLVDLGKVSDLTWSPDGRRFAFVSNRPEHSIVGVYDLQQRTITWQSPSLDQDTSPVFSADGAQLAFIRVPSEKTPIFVSQRTGQPWSIWVTEVSRGSGRQVWVADSGRGSVFHPTLSDSSLLWTARQELVFPWEKTGWLQLYTVPVAGGTAKAITSGSSEVMHMELSLDRRKLVFSSTQDDSDRLHVWSVEPGNGTPKRIGSGASIEDYPRVSADGEMTFALRSDAVHPLQPVVAVGNQWKQIAPQTVPTDFPSAKLVTPEAVIFPAKDGQNVHGQLFLPKDAGSGKQHPAVLFFHGGPRRQMVLGFHPMDAYNWMYAENQYLASEGYVVLSVNYRGGIGYGLDYREAENFGPGGGSELNDLLGAITYLQSRKDIDRSKLGIWGGSYGGLMTALGLARASESLAAGVDYAGVHNWASFLASIGMAPAPGEATKTAFQSSPLATVDQWKSPVLIVQADDDRSVPSPQANELIAALRQRHIEHDTLIIPNEIHDLILHSSWLTLFHATDEYFARKLDNR
jgi:dipeptidyl aminopeptidase/acylaminoacyl peptidase